MTGAKMVFHPSGHIDLSASVEVQRKQIEFFGPEAGEFFPVEEDQSQPSPSSE